MVLSTPEDKGGTRDLQGQKGVEGLPEDSQQNLELKHNTIQFTQLPNFADTEN